MWWILVSDLLFLNAGWRGGAVGNPSVMLQRHNEDLYSLLHQLLPVVREEQVVVRDAIAHRIIGAHHIQQRGEQRQSMSRDKDTKTMLVNRVDLWVPFDSQAVITGKF